VAGEYFWSGVASSVVVLTDTRPVGVYGLSYRRSKPGIQEKEKPEESIREIIRAIVLGPDRVPEPVVVRVSVEEQGTEEIVKIEVAGVSKSDMDAIIVAILASELA